LTDSEHIKIPLKIIPEPEPETRTVLILKGLSPAFRGQGNVDLTCGNCGQVLVEGAGSGFTISNVVIKCPKCGYFNEIP